MFHGRLVEIAESEALFERAVHPYTRNLLKAVPAADLAKPLPFDEIQEAENAASWPAPFTEEPGTDLGLQELDPGHYIRIPENHKFPARI